MPEATEAMVNWDKVIHRAQVRPYLEACEAKRREIFKTYIDLRGKDPGKEVNQEVINLAFELAKLNAKSRALSYLTFHQLIPGSLDLTVRKYPQYGYLCQFCGMGSSFRIKEFAAALKMAHTEMSKQGLVTLCTMVKPDKGVLKPQDKNFDQTIKEFLGIEKLLLETK